MNNGVWKKAQNVKLQVKESINSCLDISFDKRIPADVQKQLLDFVKWIENNYVIPITLYVDFEYNHYLISREGRRVGYLFYWDDFLTYPVYESEEKIPQIRLPVRTERSTIGEILYSFIEAISLYYAWICNELCEEYTVCENEVEEILQDYLQK